MKKNFIYAAMAAMLACSLVSSCDDDDNMGGGASYIPGNRLRA